MQAIKCVGYKIYFNVLCLLVMTSKADGRIQSNDALIVGGIEKRKCEDRSWESGTCWGSWEEEYWNQHTHRCTAKLSY